MTRATVVVALVLAMSGQVLAGDIGIEMTATVTSVEDSNGLLGGAVGVGDTITVKYVYNSDTLVSGSGEYLYTAAPYGIVIRMGSLIGQTDPTNVYYYIGIGDSSAGSGNDYYVVYSDNNISVPGGLDIDEIALQFNDPTGTALDSSALPLTAPVLSDWATCELLISNMPDPGDPATYFSITATVTSAALATDPYDALLPEPGTMALVGLGLAGLLRRRRARG